MQKRGEQKSILSKEVYQSNASVCRYSSSIARLDERTCDHCRRATVLAVSLSIEAGPHTDTPTERLDFADSTN